jgi:hypothetical protein
LHTERVDGGDKNHEHQHHVCQVGDERHQCLVDILRVHDLAQPARNQSDNNTTDIEYCDRGDQVDREIDTGRLDNCYNVFPVETHVRERDFVHL